MKRGWYAAILVLAALGVVWFVKSRNNTGEGDIQYRYEKVTKGELVRSTSAVGILEPLTKVDIRSKAGGKVIALKVEEGDKVKTGDVIALIDPSDTQAVYDQAKADLDSSEARAQSARITAGLEAQDRRNALNNAKQALEISKIRLDRSQKLASVQPTLTQSDLKSAQASLSAAQHALQQAKEVDAPRSRREAQVGADKARSDMDAAQAEYNRQDSLYKQDFVAKAAVERARQSLDSAKAANANAQERLRTVEQEIDLTIRTAQTRVDQAQAALKQSSANQSRDYTTQKDLEEAKRAYEQAKLTLQRAENDMANIQIRQTDTVSAQAGTVRSRVSVTNAKVQLDSTTVQAPRDGVVTTKYLEEGTIIPPGTSTFAQGTAIVQLSDVSQMFVDCAVDESDVSQVKLGQTVRIVLEAFPGARMMGVVDRLSPAAVTESNVTSVKVKVRITDSDHQEILPGMNATCEFLTLEKKNVLMVPQQAIKREDGKSYVRIKTGENSEPRKVEVKLGEVGNDSIEVVSGVNEGDEVVTAEINLAQIRDIQNRMEQAQQGGGLTGGGQRPGGNSLRGAAGTAGGAGGGARGGAGAGGTGGAARGGAGGGGGTGGGRARGPGG